MRKSSSKTMSVSIVVSLESKEKIFTLVCNSKSRATEDVGTCAVDVCLIKTLVDSPNQWGVFSSPWTRDNIRRTVSTDDWVCATGRSWTRINILSFSDSKGEDSLSNSDLKLKNVTSA